MSLVICICTYNRNQSLLECLKSIKKLRIKKNLKIKIIIIDNSLKKNSYTMINRIKKKFKFKIFYISEKKRGIVYARNKCLNELKKIKPKYAAFIDDDCTVDKFWITNALKIFSIKNAEVVTGPQIYKKKITSNKIVKNNFAEFFEKKINNSISKVKWAASNNVFFKYDIINNQNVSFDKNLNKFGIGEDQLFFSLLNKKGFKIYWSKKVKVYEKTHKHRSNVEWLMERSYRLGILGHYIDIKLNGKFLGYLINYLKSLYYFINAIYKLLFIFDKNLKINFLNSFFRSYGRLIGPFRIKKIQFYKK